MNISQEGDYALRAIRTMYNLGEDNRIEASVIAEKEEIPLRFLFKILRKLRKAGIVDSFRGTNGGYVLKKPLEELTIKDVIEAVEGPIYINKCVGDKKACILCQKGCSLYSEMMEIEREILNILSRKSLKEILEQKDKIKFV
ncbi:MAG: RrF2 family transcriptional regulator [Clostridium sp.]|uniref:RrF2 family transcriptional regulator n=1 Tax=Clostridium sp. TaxID=1506 RepID=UPI003F2BD013